MSLHACFDRLRQNGQCGLIPFITAGDPDLGTTAEALSVLDRAGADIIELGVPYSDPLADGPTIQAAATRALHNGTRLDGVLEMLSSQRDSLKAPVVLFTYYNPILNRGVDRFLSDIARAGASGLVVPDLPLEEAETIATAAGDRGIEVVLLVAPTTPPERIAAIAERSRGFIYLVSVTGVTGARSQLQSRVKELLDKMRTLTDKPIGVGFGISTPEQARQVRDWGADAVICGSAFVKRLADPNAGLAEVDAFCRSLKQAIS